MKLFYTLLAVIVLATAVSAIPVTVDDVQLDDISLEPGLLNRVAIERGEEYEVEVRFTALADLENVEVQVDVDGYEFGDIDDITDATAIFDADENTTYVKKLKIKFPTDIEEDVYKLRVSVADRDHYAEVASYNLKIQAPRHGISIEDVVFNPSGAVKAGSALLVQVRVENIGAKEQDDVRVTVSIPALGLSGIDYIDEIENENEEEETEEIYMRLPRCTKAGAYDAVITVDYNNKRDQASLNKVINVIADETCGTDSVPKTTITLGTNRQEAGAGQSANFPITLANNGQTSTTFTISPKETDWADVTVTPTSALVVGKGETKTVFINVAVNEDTPTGAHATAVSVMTGSSTEELNLVVDVPETKKTAFVGFFEITLAVLLILLVIIGIGIGLSRMRDKEAKEYY